jgi:hypothetical protein
LTRLARKSIITRFGCADAWLFPKRFIVEEFFMRDTRLPSALSLVLLLSVSCLSASENSAPAIPDLPQKSQASIRGANRNMRELPASPTRNPGAAPTEGPWAQLAQPVATRDQSGLYFGTSVAVSGNVMVIGELYTFTGIGEALVFVRPKTGDLNNWTQSAVLVPSDGTNDDLFASSVAISGNTIVVGSPPYEACNGCGPGRAYVYVEPAGGWSGTLTERAELTASDAITGAAVGSSVSISSDTVVAGAPGEMPGAAYVFVKPSSGWVSMTQTAKLTASKGAPGNQFGLSVSISDSAIGVGAPYDGIAPPAGAAYVFTEPAGGWTNMTQTATFTASDPNSSDQFGLAVAVDGKTFVAGAPYAEAHAARSGAAYVFVEPAGGWKNMTQTAKLTAPDGQQYDAFGSAVAISMNTVVSGAPQRSPGWRTSQGFPAWWQAGGAYMFTKSDSSWTHASVQVLNGSDAHNDDLTGSAVAIDSDVVVAGAPKLGKYLGAAFVFVKH